MSEDPNIKFSYMWNKLVYTKLDGIFTTIRSYNPQKLAYYEAKQGQILDMLLVTAKETKTTKLFKAKLLQVVVIDQPSHALLEYDADNKQEWIEKIGMNDKNLLLILQKVS